MKIDRDTYEKVVARADYWVGETCSKGKGEAMANDLLRAAGIEVPPEPILKGVSGGNWTACKRDDNRYDIWAVGAKYAVAYSVRKCDKDVLANSKKVVEAAVELLKDQWPTKLETFNEDIYSEYAALRDICKEAGATI